MPTALFQYFVYYLLQTTNNKRKAEKLRKHSMTDADSPLSIFCLLFATKRQRLFTNYENNIQQKIN